MFFLLLEAYFCLQEILEGLFQYVKCYKSVADMESLLGWYLYITQYCVILLRNVIY